MRDIEYTVEEMLVKAQEFRAQADEVGHYPSISRSAFMIEANYWLLLALLRQSPAKP